MQKENTRFLIDTNLFIAATKRGKTKSTELLLKLLEGPWDLVADDILVSEYEKYATQFEAYAFLRLLLYRVVIVEQSDEDIMKCKPFFPANASADIIHAATCLSVNAILISNDAHFRAIKEARLIDVWTISDAIERLIN